MIDLHKLDKKIDKVFKKETSKSLTKWLIDKRTIKAKSRAKQLGFFIYTKTINIRKP